MKKSFVVVSLVALLGVASFVIAQAPAPKPATSDSSLDRIREQNDQILQKQDDILKKLDELSRDLAQIRRRTS